MSGSGCDLLIQIGRGMILAYSGNVLPAGQKDNKSGNGLNITPFFDVTTKLASEIFPVRVTSKSTIFFT